LGAAGGLLQVALVGIILANVASFIVSHQAYGDLLIATLTAFVLGLALSGPRWASASAPAPAAARQSAWPLHA
jgi:predicted lipid-binding transport protein (Tim44 family)